MDTLLAAYRAFVVALRFMTIIPFGDLSGTDEADHDRSVHAYAAVGLLIGLVLALLLVVFGSGSSLLAAAVLLTVWVGITGALHLDGLADCADAWIGGLGDRERTLMIMKDPTSGPIAVVILVLVLLLKFAALDAVITSGDWIALLWIPVIARLGVGAQLLWTPYARSDGLGASLGSALTTETVLMAVALVVVGMLLSLGNSALPLLMAALVVGIVVRILAMRRLGGVTGDILGAHIELTETICLLVIATR